jgi:hypothetical protein
LEYSIPASARSRRIAVGVGHIRDFVEARHLAAAGIPRDDGGANPLRVLRTGALEGDDLLGDIRTDDGVRRAKHQQKPAVGERRRDLGREIVTGRRVRFVPEYGIDPLRNRVAVLILLADEIARHFISLERMMQPRGPLPAGIPIVRVAIADETPILALPRFCAFLFRGCLRQHTRWKRSVNGASRAWEAAKPTAGR